MSSFRSLRPHVSVDSVGSSTHSKRKLTIVTPPKKKKLSAAVSYKNQFKQALLCKYKKGENEEQIEALLEGAIKSPKVFKQKSQETCVTNSIDFRKELQSVTSMSLKPSKIFQNTLWSLTSPVNKLMDL